MAKIKKIKLRENGIYGEAINLGADAINVDLLDGTNVEESLLNIVYHEDSTEVENIELGYEHQENKTQIVNRESTEAQYPSAKAVYDAILANKELGLVIEVVDELPGDTDVINELAIYLTPNGEDQGENIYSEYVRINGKWEFIGTTKVDLSNYYTKIESDERYAKAEIYADTVINLGRKAETEIGENSVAEGFEVEASGRGSHAEGLYSIAKGIGAHAEGGNVDTVAWSLIDDKLFTGEANATTYQVTYTDGSANSTILQWLYARRGKKIAINSEQPFSEAATILDNDYTHVDGTMIVTVTLDKTLSNNALSNQMIYLEEETMTQAIGDFSHAEGQGTVAYGNAQHVEGRFNQIDYSKTYAHILGNGTAGNRSNAHTIDYDGNAWFSGDIYVGSENGINKDEGSKKLATEEYVDTKATIIKTIPTKATQEEQAAIMNELYQAYLSGCDVKLIYEGYVYDHALTIDSKNFSFYCGYREAQTINNSYSQWQARRIVGRLENNVITYVYIERVNINTISPGIKYGTPYEPEYDSSPATKKYVDDNSISRYSLPYQVSTQEERLTIGQKIYDDYKAGKVVELLEVDNGNIVNIYRVYSSYDNSIRLVGTMTQSYYGDSDRLSYNYYDISATNDIVTWCEAGGEGYSYLSTTYDYSTPYMPMYDGSPATKKYVDDSIIAAITAAIEEAY